jgi:hypothetical protein
MSRPARSKLHREVEAILRATGLVWSIEGGSRHDIITLAGQRVGVMSHGHKTDSDSKKIAASIRQFMRQQQRA